MESLTLGIAVIASALIFLLRPAYGLVVFIASMAYYPAYCTVQIGTVDFSASRIVILALYAKIFLSTNLPKRFRFIWLDKIIIAYFTAQILSNIFTAPIQELLENRFGAAFDMVLPYFAVRLIITNKEKYLTVLKGVLLIAAPLALMGLYQSLTGHNPMGFLRRYHAWSLKSATLGYRPRLRHGFYRADVTFPMSIMFGLFFAFFGPVCFGLWRSVKKNKEYYIIAFVLMGIGVFASMSSGPIMAAVLAIAFILFYYFRKYWKPVLVTIIIMSAAVEVASNRHFWDVLCRFTLAESAGWYRSKLIEVAIFEGGMDGHWVRGFGYDTDPGWGPRIDGRLHTDLVNHFISRLTRYGLIGFIPFVIMNIAVIRRLTHAYRISVFDSDRWLIWCLSAGLFGLWTSMMSVSLFGEPTTVYYMMMGFAAMMPVIVTNREFVRAKAMQFVNMPSLDSYTAPA